MLYGQEPLPDDGGDFGPPCLWDEIFGLFVCGLTMWFVSQ